MKNFHTHTKRCRHAAGEDEEYVLSAIENGFDEIGFSDHAPMLFPQGCGYYSTFRMFPQDAEDYVESIEKLKNKYKDKIKIHVGFELEYYPELFEKELEYLKSFDIDYLIMGQHYINNEYDYQGHYNANETKDELVLKKYVSQCLEGLETGVFTYLAHPDILNFTGDENVYLREMKRLCEGAKRLNIPLEFNFLGFEDKRTYPRDDFWKIAAQTGNDVIMGLDAHTPKFFAMKDCINQMADHLNGLSITPIKRPSIRKP